jgi:hypothetical protein
MDILISVQKNKNSIIHAFQLPSALADGQNSIAAIRDLAQHFAN